MKKTITKSEYLQVLGLMALAADANKRGQAIQESLNSLFAVTPEDENVSGVGDPEHIGDAVWSHTNADELLRKLGVVVDD